MLLQLLRSQLPFHLLLLVELYAIDIGLSLIGQLLHWPRAVEGFHVDFWLIFEETLPKYLLGFV